MCAAVLSPSWEDPVLQAGGLTAQPAALVAGGAATAQGGAGRGEGRDQQAAQRCFGGERERNLTGMQVRTFKKKTYGKASGWRREMK